MLWVKTYSDIKSEDITFCDTILSLIVSVKHNFCPHYLKNIIKSRDIITPFNVSLINMSINDSLTCSVCGELLLQYVHISWIKFVKLWCNNLQDSFITFIFLYEMLLYIYAPLYYKRNYISFLKTYWNNT